MKIGKAQDEITLKVFGCLNSVLENEEQLCDVHASLQDLNALKWLKIKVNAHCFVLIRQIHQSSAEDIRW